MDLPRDTATGGIPERRIPGRFGPLGFLAVSISYFVWGRVNDWEDALPRSSWPLLAGCVVITAALLCVPGLPRQLGIGVLIGWTGPPLALMVVLALEKLTSPDVSAAAVGRQLLVWIGIAAVVGGPPHLLSRYRVRRAHRTARQADPPRAS